MADNPTTIVTTHNAAQAQATQDRKEVPYRSWGIYLAALIAFGGTVWMVYDFIDYIRRPSTPAQLSGKSPSNSAAFQPFSGGTWAPSAPDFSEPVHPRFGYCIIWADVPVNVKHVAGGQEKITASNFDHDGNTTQVQFQSRTRKQIFVSWAQYPASWKECEQTLPPPQ